MGAPTPTFKVVEKDNGWAAITRLLQDLAAGETYVRAGVIGEKGDAQHQGEPITVARLAAVHEFGASIQVGDRTITIPERSFIRAPWAAKRDEYLALLKKAAFAVLKRKISPADFPRYLTALGMKMVADMQGAIRAGIEPPLAASTLARRTKGTGKAAAGARAVPLLDTGQLINSLSHQVVVGGKDKA